MTKNAINAILKTIKIKQKIYIVSTEDPQPANKYITRD